mmetsp:Transcript_35981/g.76836  ORF Transcript_35981/g.76836 Transcript_35981/m.76836 type:complete len:252 (-) Transcript_35981:403-1158(-)
MYTRASRRRPRVLRHRFGRPSTVHTLSMAVDGSHLDAHRSHLGLHGGLRLGRLEELVPVGFAVEIALVELECIAELPREALLHTDGAVQLPQRCLCHVVHLPVGVAVQNGPQRLLNAEVEERLAELVVAADQVADGKAALALHARVVEVLHKGVGDGDQAAGLGDGDAIGRHAQGHVAERGDRVGLHARVVGVQQHRLHDRHVATSLNDAGLTLVVPRDVGEEETRLLGNRGVGDVVSQLGDRELERVHVG